MIEPSQPPDTGPLTMRDRERLLERRFAIMWARAAERAFRLQVAQKLALALKAPNGG